MCVQGAESSGVKRVKDIDRSLVPHRPCLRRFSLSHSLTPSLSLSLSLTLSLPHSLTLSLSHSLTPSLPHSLTPSLPHSQTPSLPHSGGSRTPNRESRNTQSEPQNPESRNQKPEIRNTINEARNRRCPCLRTYPKLEPRNPCLRSENRKPKSAPMSLASDVPEPRNPKPETLNPKC